MQRRGCLVLQFRGQATVLPCPTAFFQSLLDALKYPVKMKVVPELSERCTTCIGLGREGDVCVYALDCWVVPRGYFALEDVGDDFACEM